MIGLAIFGLIVYLPGLTRTPPASFGAPVRAGGRLYLLTGQWQSSPFSRGSSRSQATDLLVDLWSFDATTLRPIYRRRIQKLRDGAMFGRALLGVQSGTAWLLLPTGLHAAELSTGALRATPQRIEELNPVLRGVLPTEGRYYTLSPDGLSIKAADAKVWYLHPDSLLVSERPVGIAATPPPYWAPDATLSYQERGFTIGKKWLGVLTAAEARSFTQYNSIGGIGEQIARALYVADVGARDTFFGERPTYSNLQPLTQEFLMPGLLAMHQPTGPGQAIYRRDPDSVFVLHPSRIDQARVLQLARVSGPGGKILWNIALPLTVLQSVLPGEESLVLYGRLFTPGDPNVARDPMHTAQEILVSIDWKTGAVKQHNQSDLKAHPEAKD